MHGLSSEVFEAEIYFLLNYSINDNYVLCSHADIVSKPYTVT